MFAHAAERKIEWWLMMVGETAAFNIVAVIDRAHQKDFGGNFALWGPYAGGPIWCAIGGPYNFMGHLWIFETTCLVCLWQYVLNVVPFLLLLV